MNGKRDRAFWYYISSLLLCSMNCILCALCFIKGSKGYEMPENHSASESTELVFLHCYEYFLVETELGLSCYFVDRACVLCNNAHFYLLFGVRQ